MSSGTKERVTVSLDADAAQYLATKDNKSAYVNRLIREDMAGEAIDVKLLSMRREMVAGQLDEMRSRMQTKEAELAEIESRLDRYEDSRENVLDRAADTLTRGQLNEDNPAVQRFAEEAGLDEDRLIREVEERMESVTTEYYDSYS